MDLQAYTIVSASLPSFSVPTGKKLDIMSIHFHLLLTMALDGT